MASSTFTESTVEQAALDWLEASGWRIAHRPDIAPDQPFAERRDDGEVVLVHLLRDAVRRPSSGRSRVLRSADPRTSVQPTNKLAFSRLPALSCRMPGNRISPRHLAPRLREALLPKLISGELRMKDAERFLEERGL